MTGPGEPPRATCKHGDHRISLQPGTGVWLDDDGKAACVKAPLESVGHGQPASLVLHEPMPDLGGAQA